MNDKCCRTCYFFSSGEVIVADLAPIKCDKDNLPDGCTDTTEFVCDEYQRKEQ